MGSLKSDLDQYLLQNETRKSYKISLPFSTPTFFSRSNDETPSSSGSAGTWFEEVQKDYCTLSRTQRFMGFGACLFLGILCFCLSFLYIPVLVFKAMKFVLLLTLGSLFMLFSFSFLYGPWNHIKSMFTKERALPTSCYLFTLLATLYSALHLQSTPWTIVCAVFQVMSLLWMMLGSVPGGATGARFFGSMFKSSVSSTLPI
ncbi:got1/Sft2-like family domain-containing protein [Phthorimaea operculella]|nr:got1/Sft2-like family domain-containing protein [Phthorimaea operculella]